MGNVSEMQPRGQKGWPIQDSVALAGGASHHLQMPSRLPRPADPVKGNEVVVTSSVEVAVECTGISAGGSSRSETGLPWRIQGHAEYNFNFPSSCEPGWPPRQ